MKTRRIWVVSASFACAGIAAGTLAGGCVSTSNAPDLGGALDGSFTFDGAGFDAAGFDATGLDVSSFPRPDGSGGGSLDGGSGADDGGGSTPLDASPQLLVSALANPALKLVAGGGYLAWSTYSSGATSPVLGVYDTHDGGLTLVTAVTPIGDLAIDDAGVRFFTGIELDLLPFGSTTPENLGGAEILSNEPTGLTVHGSEAYFVVGSGIYRMPSTGSGGVPALVFAGTWTVPRGLAFAGGNVYVASLESAGSARIDSIAESALGVDAGADAAVPVVTAQSDALGLVTDGTHLAWSTLTTDVPSVASANLDGGSLVQYAPVASSTFIACDGKNVYWGSPGAVSDAGLYPSYNLVMRAPIGNPSAAQGLYQVEDVVESVTVDGTWVYWSTLNGKQIFRAPK